MEAGAEGRLRHRRGGPGGRQHLLDPAEKLRERGDRGAQADVAVRLGRVGAPAGLAVEAERQSDVAGERDRAAAEQGGRAKEALSPREVCAYEHWTRMPLLGHFPSEPRVQ